MKQTTRDINKYIFPTALAAAFTLFLSLNTTTQAVSVSSTASAQNYNIADFEGLEYSSSTAALPGITIGWQFTVNDADVYVTELAALTAHASDGDVVQLWNAQSGELLAEASIQNQSDLGWQYYALDQAVGLEQGGNYAVTVSASGTTEIGALENVSNTADDPVNPTGTIAYEATVLSPEEGQSFSELGVLGNGRPFQSFLSSDIGFQIGAPSASDGQDGNGVAVPTPAAAVLGVVALGGLLLRRTRAPQKIE
ncbi:DUF4082 domain-containing protein [Planctomycetota bacterium]|nr:DUF4082 domain-containing protein [Planctomycetota bacterium]